MCLCVPASTWLRWAGAARLCWLNLVPVLYKPPLGHQLICMRLYTAAPTSPVPALSYVQRTHKEISRNCRDGCFGLNRKVNVFFKNLILSLNKQKIQLTFPTFTLPPVQTFQMSSKSSKLKWDFPSWPFRADVLHNRVHCGPQWCIR